ncbi:hypothetical protein HPB50_009805 [Hyalomma asiaticum]|uniref:Uncharacterized protein n=1 Tax=Hyalomma asiaticum TaxID=266040 RepID=A0ACB7RU91_HYAAI|nr:hypothetical protein HPB50_009805 [Hyalomma asiaticum]
MDSAHSPSSSYVHWCGGCGAYKCGENATESLFVVGYGFRMDGTLHRSRRGRLDYSALEFVPPRFVCVLCEKHQGPFKGVKGFKASRLQGILLFISPAVPSLFLTCCREIAQIYDTPRRQGCFSSRCNSNSSSPSRATAARAAPARPAPTGTTTTTVARTALPVPQPHTTTRPPRCRRAVEDLEAELAAVTTTALPHPPRPQDSNRRSIGGSGGPKSPGGIGADDNSCGSYGDSSAAPSSPTPLSTTSESSRSPSPRQGPQ